MKIHHHIHIYKKTFLLLLLSIIFPSLLVGIAAYRISTTILTEKMLNSYEDSFHFAAEHVQEQLKQIQQLSDYLFFDEDIKELLTRKDTNSYSYIKQQELVEEHLKNYLYFSSYGDYKMIQLYGKHGKSLSLSFDASLLLYNEELIEKDLKEKTSAKNSQLEIDPINSRYIAKKNSDAYASYTILRPILNDHLTEKIGGMFISLSPELFSSLNSLYEQNLDQKIFLLNHTNTPMNAEPSREEYNLLNSLDFNTTHSFKILQNDQTVFFCPLTDTSWKMVGILSSEKLTEKNKTIFYTTAVSFLLALLLTSLLSRFLVERIFHPLETLQKSVLNIKTSDLHTRVPVLSEDEIGELSKNINTMLDQLEESHQQQLLKQQALQDARYHALQTSINPHFLYNTLNTIRWLAIIQKAENIKTVTETLSRLLRSTVKQDPAAHCIKIELQILNDYLLIQQIAYSHRFTVEWELDQTLEEVHCIPFILQPLAENSIFHGLLPKATAGFIRISTRKIIFQNVQTAEIEIYDNGEGISPEKVDSILTSETVNKYGLNGIGVSNVNERLILSYGKDYGLQIHSDSKSYTSVIIHIPITKH